MNGLWRGGGTGGPGGGPQPRLQPKLTWSVVGTPCHKGCHTLAFGRWEVIRGRELAGTTPRTKSPGVLHETTRIAGVLPEATKISSPGVLQKRRGWVVLVSLRNEECRRQESSSTLAPRIIAGSGIDVGGRVARCWSEGAGLAPFGGAAYLFLRPSWVEQRGLDLNQRPLGYEPFLIRRHGQRHTNNTSKLALLTLSDFGPTG
jgi:hypothetical protein